MADMLSRRVFTQSVASLAVAGACGLVLAPAVGARQVSADLSATGDAPDKELGEQGALETPEPTETPDAELDSGNHLGQDKASVTPDPALIATHDNGKHLGLLKTHQNDKLRGVGFWANLTKKPH